MKKQLRLEGLDCAVCAQELENRICKLDGVNQAKVNFVSQRLDVEFENENVLQRVLDTANNFEDVHVLEDGKGSGEGFLAKHKVDAACIVLSALLFIAALFVHDGPGRYVLYGGAYILVGWKVILETFKNLAEGRVFDENFLMTLASIGAAVLGEYDEAVAVMLLYQIGELLQQAAVENSRSSITEIVKMRSEKATLIVDHKQKSVKPEELNAGDLIMVRPGDIFPVDGVIERGSTSVDMKNLTGEPIPVDVTKGDQVLSGTVNAGTAVLVKVLRPYEESAVARVLDMVENSVAVKAEPEKFITKFARVYTPIVCVLAIIAAFGVPTLIGIATGSWPFAQWVRKALVFLVVSCPCALVISVPLTYFSGIGCAAKNGILVKGATFLDTAAKIKTAAFDKTGTLTQAEFRISRVEGEDTELVLNTLAAIEKFSAHPIAEPFAKLQTPLEATDVQELPGMGIVCRIDGKQALAGNKRLMEKYGIAVSEAETGAAAVYTALDGRYLGYAAVDDTVKDEAAQVMAQLRELGIEKTVMLTGDREERGRQIAELVGIDSVKGDLLPEGKLLACRELKSEGPVLYTGDGINDAPVMTEADVSVSMGKLGSGAAIESSDVVLVSDSLTGLPKLIRLARETRKIVMENIVFSIAIKVIIMVIGIFVLFPLWYAVLADVGVMLLAVANSLKTKLIKL